MSTSYYRLRLPITHLRVDEHGPGAPHVGMVVWVNHGLAGSLTLRREEVPGMLRTFMEYEEDNECPIRTYYGGVETGAVVTEREGEHLPDETVVISEYAELLSMGEVRARAGHGKGATAAGIGELFGYGGVERGPEP